MRGKAITEKRVIKPDARYKSMMVAKFMTYMMRRGKKSVASKIIYESFDIIKEKTKKDPLNVFEVAIANASPILEVRPRRIGGANYQIPMEVPKHRATAIAMRWIIQAACDRQGKSMSEFLSGELIDAYNKVGSAMKKREDVHKMAEANRAFAHFARMG